MNVTKHDVLAVFKAHPNWSSGLIADELGCESAYVRATLSRCGKRLARREKCVTRRHLQPDSIAALGQAARRAGLTVAAIEALAREPEIGSSLVHAQFLEDGGA